MIFFFKRDHLLYFAVQVTSGPPQLGQGALSALPLFSREEIVGGLGQDKHPQERYHGDDGADAGEDIPSGHTSYYVLK